jgi:hypothetical protein
MLYPLSYEGATAVGWMWRPPAGPSCHERTGGRRSPAQARQGEW